MLTLLSLPLEIRLLIYEHALRAGTPIDLWPTPEKHDKLDCSDANDDEEREVLIRQAFSDIRGRLCVSLLRTCHQINAEASHVFYPTNNFSFSAEFGWLILYHVLTTIGPQNRRLLNRLTMVFPNNDDMH